MKGELLMLGEMKLFTWKSKEQQKQEQEAYELWAFPYGQLQRDNLTALLLAVFPRESIPTTLIPFLTCRELYEGLLKDFGSSDAAANSLINDVKKYKRIIRKADMPTYIALVLANEKIDEKAEYPTVVEIKRHAAQLELLRK